MIPSEGPASERDAAGTEARTSPGARSATADDRASQERLKKAEMRQGGMVAAAVLLFLALFTTLIVWIA